MFLGNGNGTFQQRLKSILRAWIWLQPLLLWAVPPPTANIFTPSPNRSHVVNSDAINVKPIWWQVIPVLVNKQSDWPSKDGTSGITSEEALTAAENSGDAIQVFNIGLVGVMPLGCHSLIAVSPREDP
jgi:hypothetical protein